MLSSQIMKLLRVTNYNTSVLCRQKNIAIIFMFQCAWHMFRSRDSRGKEYRKEIAMQVLTRKYMLLHAS